MRDAVWWWGEIFSRRGYSQLGRAKWRGESCRFYFLCALLSPNELARYGLDLRLIGRDFSVEIEYGQYFLGRSAVRFVDTARAVIGCAILSVDTCTWMMMIESFGKVSLCN